MTPIQAAQEIKLGMESLRIGKKEVAKLLSLSGDKMVSELLSLLELPPSIWDAVGWEGRREGKIGPDFGYIISRLPSVEDREYLAKVVLESDLSREEIRTTVQLRKRNPGMNIEACVEKVVKIRPIVKPGFVVVAQISPDLMNSLAQSRSGQEVHALLSEFLSKRLGEGGLKSVSLKDRFVILTLSEEGHLRFKNLSVELGVSPESILDALVEREVSKKNE